MSSPGVGWVEDTNCKAPLIIQMLKGAIEVNKLLLNYYYYYKLIKDTRQGEPKFEEQNCIPLGELFAF